MGDNPSLVEFLDFIHGDKQPLSFSRVIPEPKWGGENSCGHGSEIVSLSPDRIEWRVSHWGTQCDLDEWEESSVDVRFFPGRVEMIFNTAWNPPIPVIHALSGKFPKLNFDHIFSDEYSEGSGRVIWKRGKEIFRRFHQLGEADHEIICRGVRPEEGQVEIVDWHDQVPLNNGLAIADKTFRWVDDYFLTKDGGGKELNRTDKLRRVMLKFERSVSMGERVFQETLGRASKMGFSLPDWERAGLGLLTDYWGWCGGALPAKFPSFPSGGLSVDREGRTGDNSWLILREGKRGDGGEGRVDNSYGKIRFLSHGFEICLHSGWSVCGLLKGGEKGAVVTKYQGEAENWLDGEASCIELKADRKSGKIYKFGEAHCSHSKLWDPDPEDAAIKLWHPNGQLKFIARFLNNQHLSKTSGPRAVHYGEDGREIQIEGEVDVTIADTANHHSRQTGVAPPIIDPVL